MSTISAVLFVENELLDRLSKECTAEEKQILVRTLDHHSRDFCSDFFYRIWQAVLSIFGASDWQCSQVILENKGVEKSERLLYHGLDRIRHTIRVKSEVPQIVSIGKSLTWQCAHKLKYEFNQFSMRVEEPLQSYCKSIDHLAVQVHQYCRVQFETISASIEGPLHRYFEFTDRLWQNALAILVPTQK